MKNCSRHTGTLRVIKRLRPSRNGNPRFMLSVDGWTCLTVPNSQLAFNIARYDGKRVEATLGTLRGACHVQDVRLT